MTRVSSVLDLPEDRQREIAQRNGQSLAQWRAGVIERDKRAAEFSARLDVVEGIRPSEATEEEIDRFQARIDSGNP